MEDRVSVHAWYDNKVGAWGWMVGANKRLRGHTTTPRSEAAALARRRWAVGFGARARACADTRQGTTPRSEAAALARRRC